jgi:hypothetical protein
MNKSREIATVKANSTRALGVDLVHKIASFLGSEEKRITEIPGLSLHPANIAHTTVPSNVPSGHPRRRSGSEASKPWSQKVSLTMSQITFLPQWVCRL